MNCIVIDRSTPVKQLRKLMSFDLDGTLTQLMGFERFSKMSGDERSLVTKFNDSELTRFVDRVAA